MYFEKDKFSINYDRNKTELACLEMLVPEDHLVRKVEKVLDLSFIHELTKDLYCKDNGRRCIDTVILFKILILNFLFGNNSIRKTCEEAKVNMAYRWYLGIGISDTIPNYSTFSQNYIRKFSNTDIFEKIFEHVIEVLFEYKVIDTSIIFVDGTHIKANANKKKTEKKQIKVITDKYHKELKKEINEFRELNGRDKYPSDDDNDEGDGDYTIDDKTGEIKENTDNKDVKEIKVSTTDPDCGVFNKGEHEIQLAYVDQVACDIHGWIMGYEVSPGNVHDSKAFLPFFENKLLKLNPKTICADAGYANALCAHIVQENNCKLLVPYTAPKGKKTEFGKRVFEYIPEIDNFICPNKKLLVPWNIDKDGYIEYKIHKTECGNCPYKKDCLKGYAFKTVRNHLYEDCMLLCRDYRLSEEGKKIYPQRKQTIERIFADGKENHGLRYTRFKGLQKNINIRALLYSCLNIKKLALLKYPTPETIRKREKNKLNEAQKLYFLFKYLKNLIKEKIVDKISTINFFDKFIFEFVNDLRYKPFGLYLFLFI